MEWYWYIVVIIIFCLLFTLFTSAYYKGWYGEFSFYSYAKFLIKNEGRMIKNLLLFKKDDSSKISQIDNLIISRRGIFVIEVKNYSGKIYGNDNQKEWTQSFNYGKQTYKFYSPVKQNLTHLNRVKEHIDKDIDIYSMIVFIKSDISSVESNYTYDINSFKRFYKSKKIKYSKEETEYIYQYFKKLKENNKKSSKEHVNKIKQNKRKIDNNICPYCNKKLVLRTGKYGDFYACDNFPKCKFTKDID